MDAIKDYLSKNKNLEGVYSSYLETYYLKTANAWDCSSLKKEKDRLSAQDADSSFLIYAFATIFSCTFWLELLNSSTPPLDFFFLVLASFLFFAFLYIAFEIKNTLNNKEIELIDLIIKENEVLNDPLPDISNFIGNVDPNNTDSPNREYSRLSINTQVRDPLQSLTKDCSQINNQLTLLENNEINELAHEIFNRIIKIKLQLGKNNIKIKCEIENLEKQTNDILDNLIKLKNLGIDDINSTEKALQGFALIDKALDQFNNDMVAKIRKDLNVKLDFLKLKASV